MCRFSRTIPPSERQDRADLAPADCFMVECPRWRINLKEQRNEESGHRSHRPRRHGREPHHEHGVEGLHRGVLQPHRREGGRLRQRPRERQEHHWLPFDPGARRQPREAPQGVLHGQGRRGGGRHDRAAARRARAGRHHHRRRQLALPGHDPPHAVRRVEGAPLRRHGRLRRRRGRAQGPVHDAGRLAGRVAVREANLPGHLREGRGRLALLRLGGRERRRTLRQDGPQRSSSARATSSCATTWA